VHGRRSAIQVGVLVESAKSGQVAVGVVFGSVDCDEYARAPAMAAIRFRACRVVSGLVERLVEFRVRRVAIAFVSRTTHTGVGGNTLESGGEARGPGVECAWLSCGEVW
jgi:hypothetical protein